MPYKTVPAVLVQIAAEPADSPEVFRAEAEQDRGGIAHLGPDRVPLEEVVEPKDPQREEARHRARLRESVANEGF